jgi:hypothetical protein
MIEGHVRCQQQDSQLHVSFFVSIRIRSGSDRGFGMQDLVGAKECSCWECGCSGMSVCNLSERVRDLTHLPGESIDALF